MTNEDDQVGPGWCWIADNYNLERLLFHYSLHPLSLLLTLVFLFIDMFALTILYVILFVYIYLQSRKFGRTQSSVDNYSSSHEMQRWQSNLEAGTGAPPPTFQNIMTTQTVTIITETPAASIRRVRNSEENARRRVTQVAVRLLCYPIVYICLTVPVSIARLAHFTGHDWNLTAIHVGAGIYVCSGWVNVLLYTATRKGIISWNWLAPRRKRKVDVPHNLERHERKSGLGNPVSDSSNTAQRVKATESSRQPSDSESDFRVNYGIEHTYGEKLMLDKYINRID